MILGIFSASREEARLEGRYMRYRLCFEIHDTGRSPIKSNQMLFAITAGVLRFFMVVVCSVSEGIGL